MLLKFSVLNIEEQLLLFSNNSVIARWFPKFGEIISINCWKCSKKKVILPLGSFIIPTSWPNFEKKNLSIPKSYLWFDFDDKIRLVRLITWNSVLYTTHCSFLHIKTNIKLPTAQKGVCVCVCTCYCVCAKESQCLAFVFIATCSLFWFLSFY